MKEECTMREGGREGKKRKERERLTVREGERVRVREIEKDGKRDR